MTFTQELRQAVSRRHPDAVFLGSVCYLRLEEETLAKIEWISSGGYYDGLRLTVLNRLSGPVDSIALHVWDLPHPTENRGSGSGERQGWDVCRPSLDTDAFLEAAEDYLRLFREPDPKSSRAR